MSRVHIQSDALTPRRELTVLITGFGPFPGAPFNPTEPLVAKLMRLRWPALLRIRIVGHVFRTSYAAVDAEVPALIEQHRPDVILLFGFASRTKFLRVETVARNARSMLLPDARGTRSSTACIERRGPAQIRGRAPFARIVSFARRMAVPTWASHNAGRYLCNYAYWRAAAFRGAAAPRLLLFVHVPRVNRAGRPRSRVHTRSITPSELVRAAEGILRILAAEGRALHAEKLS